MRSIALHIEPNDWSILQTQTGGAAAAALSYLTTWAISSERIRHVRIMASESDCELSALYGAQENDPKALLLVAIWHASEQRYSFHT